MILVDCNKITMYDPHNTTGSSEISTSLVRLCTVYGSNLTKDIEM